MSSVHYAFDGGAARITLADPQRGNPLDPAMAAALLHAVRRARADDARVVVLRGQGRAFSFGGDVGAFAAAEDPEQLVDDLAETLHRAVSDLHRMNAVVVSVVHGTAAGAGVPLAAAADVVLAGASARFTLAYTKIGLSPDGGSSLLTASLGLHRALHLALLNPVLTAEQAHAAGLVAEVHPDDELDAAVERVVAQLLAGSRTAQVAAKRLLRDVALPGAEGALRRETLSIRAAAAGPDGREGVAAFVAKRSARFPSSGG
ncbi:enoyl-CoA hydratase/isomerase family protein [Pseudonocardia sp. GCM10023141]|uniref:enoyl-CoA hydratase/isomerase family protein n=1 Tax=Pseudonocardia sp. GCM10023141 TaxID=3252653 RepID=UPI00362308E6